MTMLRKSELVVVARAKGWRGSESRLDREYFVRWLSEHDVGESEQRDLVRRWKSGTIGADGVQTAVTPAGGVSRTDVSAMIAEAITALEDQLSPDTNSSIGVDADALNKMIVEAVAKAQPARIILQDERDSKPVTLKERTHPLFEKVLRLVKAGMNVLLVGPAGCGKTTLAHQIAKALKRKYGTLHCTAGASESQLTGWLLPTGESGEFTYVPSEFVKLYEEGNSVFLLDEIDAADPNVLLVINAALANGALHVPQRYSNPHVARGNNAAIIAAANTFGTGADTVYAGRSQLDGATLDRFYVIEMSYDEALEAEIAGDTPQHVDVWQAADKPTDDELLGLRHWVKELRQRVVANRVRRVVSTRMLQKAIAARKAGIAVNELKRDLLAGWTRDELTKAGA